MEKQTPVTQAPVASQNLTPEDLGLLFENMISPFSYYRMVYDEHGVPVNYIFLAVNRAFETETGLKREDIIGKSVLSIYPQTEKYWIECFGRVAKTGVPERTSNYAKALDSWYDIIAYSPKPDHVAITVVNTTEAVKKRMMLVEKTLELNLQQDENYRLAHEDPVTHLPNRASLSAAFVSYAKAYAQTGRPFALALMSLDGFTELSATYGSLLGERILTAVAGILRLNLLPEESLFCLSGSVFALLLPCSENGRCEVERLDKLLAAINEPLEMEGDYFRMTASCGVALYPRHGQSEDILIMRANLARYSVRTIGGDAFQRYSESMGDSLLRRTRIRSYLRKALDAGEFELYYQPQVDAGTGMTVGFEALLRWHSPELGEVPPLEFIPVAEENRLIIPIGAWVLETACRTLAALNADAPVPYRMAVNISGVQLMQEGFVEHALATVDAAGVPRGLVELEITESVFVNRERESIDVLNQLREAGVRVALDDFGTGYSSLSLAYELKLDTLKLERMFIKMNDTTPLVELVVRLGQALGAKIVAEGVETEAQRERVVSAGCDILQGYLFGRPEPVAAAALPPLASKASVRPVAASPQAKANRRWPA